MSCLLHHGVRAVLRHCRCSKVGSATFLAFLIEVPCHDVVLGRECGSESLVCIHGCLDFCCCLTIAPVVEVDDVVSCCGKSYLCTFFIHLLAIYHLWGRRESHHIVLGSTFYVYVERIGLYLLIVGSESLVFCHGVFEFALSRKHCAVLVCPVDKIITEFIGCSQCYLVVLLIFVRLRIDGNVCDASGLVTAESLYLFTATSVPLTVPSIVTGPKTACLLGFTPIVEVR